MTTCVMGAGLQGVLCALELADLGHHVVVFDAAQTAITGASLHNEGKIHLGYVYAKDISNKSSELMAEGASRFCQLLDRWWPAADIDATSSEPFDYLVLPESLESADRLQRLYQQIDAGISMRMSRNGRRYLGRTAVAPAYRLTQRQLESRYDPQFVDAAFRTEERAIAPSRMAEALRDALFACPTIECHWNSRVSSVEVRPDGKYNVQLDEGRAEGPFEHVVNALWSDRLRIDATLGINVRRPYLYRHKVANRVRLGAPPVDWRSATMVIGPFGDFVTLPNGSCYLSWYPAGCIRRTTELAPPQDWQHTPPGKLATVFSDTVDSLSLRIRGLDQLVARADERRSDPGIIFCWGNTDVDDPESELHYRHDVGVSNPRPGYYSVDTGKLTTAPIFAEQVADMIGAR